ncbi:MAG TPA: MaoC family dehydratase N-terminal domain-containing protein, partial [Acidimicrobiia bacterium]|nr:MaoC family dehydratase N-terminal domain-containing protein [Acidimicrobiia bacterium]
MPDSHITPQMLDLVGLELRSATSFPITDSDIRRWAIAVYYPEPAPKLFWDAKHAAATVHGGIVAPEDFNPFAWLTQTEADEGVAARPTGAFVGPEQSLGLPAPATT